jgi:hypothetical protein
MKRFHSYLAAALAFSLPTLALGASARMFNPEEFQTPEQIEQGAKGLLKASGLKKIRAKDVSKVTVVEFSVEYVTAQKKDATGRGRFGLIDIVQFAGPGKKKIEIEDTFKASLPQTLYDVFVAELEGAGYSVAPKEEVASNPAYENVKGKEAGAKKRTTSGGAVRTAKTKKLETYPVEGLMTFKQGAFSAAKNIKAETELMHGLGVDMTLRVHVRVGIAKKGRPAIEEGTIFNVAAGLKSRGPEGKESHTIENMGTVTAKKTLMYGADVVEDKEFKAFKGKVLTVNSEKFEAALMEMFPTYSKVVIAALD